MEIDEKLYSRQLYVIGHEGMKMISSSRVLIIGKNILAGEIIKNLALLGIKKIIVDVDTKNIKFLKSLNPHVNIVYGDLNSDCDIVIVCERAFRDACTVNDRCRVRKLKFIYCNVIGLTSQIFCDFGEKFVVTDQNGEAIIRCNVENCYDDGVNTFITTSTPHNLSSDDEIMVCGFIRGIKVISRNVLSVEGIFKCDIIEQVKSPIELTFKPLRETLINPKIIVSDIIDFEMPQKLHYAHLYYDKADDEEDFMELTKGVLDPDFAKLFYESTEVEIFPFYASVAGIVAQEAVKASTHKYMPIDQYLYFENFSIKDVNKVKDMHIFIIGAGAIGCEMLKNLALMGVKKITITDMDTIEKSNLSRQFLFRDHDIGKPKAEIAAQIVGYMAPECEIKYYLHKMCPETESIFGREFFESVDVIVNALDNVDARIYMDKRSRLFNKPLIDSGTLGTKGNIQTVINGLTETYSSSKDPVENEIPMCTIKNHPFMIEHTIQWAREKFETVINLPKGKNPVDAAYEQFETDFIIPVKQLLKEYPPDHKINEVPFWSGSKKIPSIINITNEYIKSFEEIYKDPVTDFDKDNDSHINFITVASNLRAKCYGIKEITAHETKGIAGKIIPAIITTTSVVSGFAAIELYKIGFGYPIESHYNYFINLALNIFHRTEPVKAKVDKIIVRGNEYKFTLWDIVHVKGTLRQVIEFLENKFDITINSLTIHSNEPFYYIRGIIGSEYLDQETQATGCSVSFTSEKDDTFPEIYLL